MVIFRNCIECNDEFDIDPEAPEWRPLYVAMSDGSVIENEFFCTDCLIP